MSMPPAAPMTPAQQALFDAHVGHAHGIAHIWIRCRGAGYYAEELDAAALRGLFYAVQHWDPARNKGGEFWRHYARKRVVFALSRPESLDGSDKGADRRVKARAVSLRGLVAEVVATDYRDDFLTRIRKCSAQERVVLCLRGLALMTELEIGMVLGLTESRISQVLKGARAALGDFGPATRPGTQGKGTPDEGSAQVSGGLGR